jgi:hypothetical protein
MHPNVRCRIDGTYVTLVVTGPGTVTAVARAPAAAPPPPLRRTGGRSPPAVRRGGLPHRRQPPGQKTSVVIEPPEPPCPSLMIMMRHAKMGLGHQRLGSTGLGHSGSRRRRCANIHCSKYFLRSHRILSFTGFPDSIQVHWQTVLVIQVTHSPWHGLTTGPLHPATVTGRNAHNDPQAFVRTVLGPPRLSRARGGFRNFKLTVTDH